MEENIVSKSIKNNHGEQVGQGLKIKFHDLGHKNGKNTEETNENRSHRMKNSQI